MKKSRPPLAFECLMSVQSNPIMHPWKPSIKPPKTITYAPVSPSPVPSLQFIPKFLAQSKRRIKELKYALEDMPKVLANYKEQWEAFRNVVSAIREELNDRVRSVSNGAITGEDEASMSITPHVTGMYKAFASGIREVSRCY